MYGILNILRKSHFTVFYIQLIFVRGTLHGNCLLYTSYHYLRYSLKKFLDKVEQSVFNSIDLYCSAPQFNIFDYSLFSLLELEKEIRRRDLSVMAMTPENCTYPVNFCTQDRGTRESSIRYYQRAIDTAEFLGCHKVQISTGFGYFDQSPEDAWKYCRDSLQQLDVYKRQK